ncbi:MAG: thioredoxin family protein [Actinobacteria bacterium]|nr:thioredoxin family protein [Actinomycetota bacterium]
MELLARLAVGVVLLASAAAKARSWRELPDLLGGYGVPRAVRAPAAVALLLVEAVLGVLLLAGVAARLATLAAFALGLVFVAAVALARARGKKRLRCGCFGTDDRSTGFLLARAAGFTLLAGLAAWGGELGAGSPSRDSLVLVLLAVLAAAVVVLAVLVLALYRQVGVLTLRLGPRAALELAEEGPEVGLEAPPLTELPRRGEVLVAFFSADCRLCRELAPAVRALAREGLPVRTVYEEEERESFTRWNVPGTPFAVHVVDGAVAAKGLVNNLEQLDELVSLGEKRRRRVA